MMKSAARKSISIIALILLLSSPCSLYPASETALEHMNAIYKLSERINRDMWEYVKTTAHDKDIGQIRHRHATMLHTVNDCINLAGKLKPYGGDSSYRDAFLFYLNLLCMILNEDYARVIDLKVISEKSYDNMESYIMARKLADQKLDDAIKKLNEKEHEFAENHSITLVDTGDRIADNLRKSKEVNRYYSAIYLLFFKCFKKEVYLADSIGRNDLEGIDRYRMELIKCSGEGLAALSSIEPYGDDDTVKKSCENCLKFYKDEASESVPALVLYIKKYEEFVEIKKSFEEKKPDTRTHEDIDSYNSRVKDINDSVKKFNMTIDYLNKTRSARIQEWNKTGESFFDRHIPK